MDKIYSYAKFTIHAGKAEEFKALARTCFDMARANEPGTLFYEWFLNEAETECVAIDCYESMAALLAHVANNAATMKKILAVTERHLEVYGANPMASIGGGKSTVANDAFYAKRFLGKL